MRCVLVAGTKGKGSTAAFLAAIADAAGMGAGLYMSPHLQSWRERIRVRGRAVGAAAFARAVDEALRPVPRLRRARPDVGEPSAFELLTVAALSHFARARCRLAILEVGLGGRYDATNAVDPAFSIVTAIGLDHQEVLGRTRALIAREKSGVLRRGRAALLARQPTDAQRALLQACREVQARCRPVAPIAPNVVLGLAGDHQRQNAGLARAAARELTSLGLAIPARAVAAGLRRAWLPGRFELVGRPPAVVLDVAHTAESTAALAAALRRRFGRRRLHVVFGCTVERDPRAVARPLRALGATFYAAAARGPRALPAAKVAAALGGEAFDDVAGALGAARRAAGPRGLVCVTGSLALVGEARSALGLPVAERLWPRQGASTRR